MARKGLSTAGNGRDKTAGSRMRTAAVKCIMTGMMTPVVVLRTACSTADIYTIEPLPSGMMHECVEGVGLDRAYRYQLQGCHKKLYKLKQYF